jgi:hypothetical protein
VTSKFLARIATALTCLVTASPAAPAEGANTLREMFAELEQCVQAQQIKGAAGSELTIVFSLRRNGSLLGKPRISFSQLAGDAVEQREFASSIAAGFDRCLPISLTDALGAAIAGRPMSMRFVLRGRETGL